MKNMAHKTKSQKRLVWALIGVGFVNAIAYVSAHAAGLLVADGGFGGVLELKEHTVQVTINNGIAVTEVDQVFLNTESRQVEALYIFPVPNGASVANFSMWINGQEMIGEVVEKKRAREIYESYKRQNRDPGLLEQVDYKTFEMRIFPIAPKAEQHIQIAYYQELNHDNDWATYVYPLATNARSGVDDTVKGKFGISFQVRSEVPIAEIESPSHEDDFVFAIHNKNFADASLETPTGSLARDVVLAYHLTRPKTGVDLLTSRRDGEDGYFCMTVTAGEELAASDTGMDYVFVMDVSGSMQSDRKLETSSNSIQAFIEALDEEDRFNVLSFNTIVEPFFQNLETATTENLEEVTKFLNSRRAKGGTTLEPALATAFKYADPDGDRILNVVILSDGLTEERERVQLLQAVESRTLNARIFCIGVGNDVNRPLLEQLAEEAGGLAAMISRGDNFERAAKAFRRKLMHPVATNLSIEFPGADIYDVVPQLAQNLYHGTPVRIYGRYRNSGETKVKLSANLNGYSWEDKIEVNLPEEETDNPEIERMWAWHRVEELQRQADKTGSRDSVIDEIIRLGEGYSIATEYTSFLVLENNEEYKRWKLDRKNALRIENDRRAQNKLRGELDAMRSASTDKLGPMREDEKETQIAQRTNTTSTSPQPRPVNQSRNQPAPTNSSSSSRGWDIDFPRGGGAIDPISGSIALALAGMTAFARRKRN